MAEARSWIDLAEILADPWINVSEMRIENYKVEKLIVDKNSNDHMQISEDITIKSENGKGSPSKGICVKNCTHWTSVGG